MRIVHSDASPDAALPLERAALAGTGAELICAGTLDPDQIAAAAGDADVLLVEYASIGRTVIERLTRCEAIVTYSIGYDHIDTRAATEQGILVVNIPAFCVDEVANHAIMLILSCAKKLLRFDRGLRTGHWPEGPALEAAFGPMGSIYDEQLGLVGFGTIARAVAIRAMALGLKVWAHDPFVEAAVFAGHGVEPAALDELIESSDYLSLHTPLMPETRGLMNADRLRRMKRTAYLVNTSRGAVVDQAALIRALQEGWIAGAGLDVFDGEPLAADSPLLAMDNVVLTPHIASYSDEAYARLRRRVGEEAARVVSGQWPTALVNPEVKGRSRFEARLRSAAL